LEGPAGGWGKWSQAGVPHKGWSCIGFEDLGQPELVCDMCERQEIRYVHYMEHPDYPETLSCGCICAGHMEEDVVAAQRRESRAHSSRQRRARWLGRQGWRLSVKGNRYIRVDGYRITVFKRDGGYKAVISRPATGFTHFGRRTFPTEAAAQLACFDALEFLKGHQSETSH
jgi:hypothetical protein